MDLTKTKEKIIATIQSSNDEVLLVELLDIIEQHDVTTSLSESQLKVLKERILKEEEGRGVYRDVREVVQEIKMKMKHV